ncbi:MAG TPA: diacylglycerol kinase family protein, partial [Candidatus Dormibacteraeota bacterium]
MVNPARIQNLPTWRRKLFRAVERSGWPEPAWYETTKGGEGRPEAREAVARGAEVLFVGGGDGTLRAAASILAGTDVALAAIPAGTGNVLALNLGLPTDVADCVLVATRGGRIRIDLGEIEGRVFTIAAGIGLDAQMMVETSNRAKSRLGWPAYVAAALRHLSEPRFEAEISLDGGPPLRRQVRSVLVANVGRLPGGISLIPSARPDDGELNIVVIGPRWLHEWAGIWFSLIGRRPRGGRLETFRARRALIRTEHPRARELDGDPLSAGTSLDVRVRPAALTVCIPEAGPPEVRRWGRPD